MKNILFIASHRKDRAPGQRFRFEQYFKYLEEHGFHCELSYIINQNDDQVLYRPGRYFSKMLIALRAWMHRWNDLRRSRQYDIVFIFREALLTGSVYFEKQFHKKGKKLVFDYDDAIWHLDVSEANKKFGWLKDPGKTAKIISLCDLVFAGNRYLANYARHHNDHVVIVPTTIDTSKYIRLAPDKKDERVCIGWSGSITTIKHFEYALPALRRIKQKHGDRVTFKVIGDATYENRELGIKGIGWKKEDEIRELSTFDIGIMPLPDDEWAKGKCGLKGLQYMALETPCIMSPVGVNTEIIEEGVNGFLATTEDEWVDKLSRLIDDPELRTRIGKKARQTVEERYSVNSQKDRYVELFKRLIG